VHGRAPIERFPTSRQLLGRLLCATLLAPLAAAALGRSIGTPWDFGIRDSAFGVIAFLAAYVAWRTSRAGWAGARRVLAAATQVAVLSPCLALLILFSGNGFYTSEALLEGTSVLLALHLAGSALERVTSARPGATQARLDAGFRAVADALLTVMLWLMVGFWVLSGFRVHEVALLLMIAAGMSGVVAVVVRLPMRWRWP